MAGRAIRGFSLQVPSFQPEEGVEFAKRVVVLYKTSSDQTFRVTFSEEAEVPTTWPSPISGEEGILLTAAGRRVPHAALDTKHERTHMDMVRERRTEAELEDILQWRLGMLRAKRGADSR